MLNTCDTRQKFSFVTPGTKVSAEVFFQRELDMLIQTKHKPLCVSKGSVFHFLSSLGVDPLLE